MKTVITATGASALAPQTSSGTIAEARDEAHRGAGQQSCWRLRGALPRGGAGEARRRRDALGRIGVAAPMGAPVPTAETFSRCWTTLGPVIYTPRGAWPLTPNARVVFHELTHVEQFWRDPVAFVVRATSAEGARGARGRGRARRHRGVVAAHGRLPTSVDAPGFMIHGYALDDSHAALTRELLAKACEAVGRGILVTDVGLTVAVWLRMNTPDAILGHARELAVMGLRGAGLRGGRRRLGGAHSVVVSGS